MDRARLAEDQGSIGLDDRIHTQISGGIVHDSRIEAAFPEFIDERWCFLVPATDNDPIIRVGNENKIVPKIEARVGGAPDGAKFLDKRRAEIVVPEPCNPDVFVFLQARR